MNKNDNPVHELATALAEQDRRDQEDRLARNSRKEWEATHGDGKGGE